ncbi:MAG: DMT family transporter [Clostridiales bacterium]|nr:DMT family transporter [Clostridiales bacterium]
MSHEELQQIQYTDASQEDVGEEKVKQTKRGVFFILLSSLFFALMGIFVRLSGDLPTFQKCFFRNLVAAVVAFALLCKSRSFKIKKGCLPALLARSIAGTVGIVCNFYAIDHLNVADASILNKLSPFFAILFSALILRERAGWKNWLLIAVAFFGALFVVKPTFSIEHTLPALIGVLGGLGAGLAYTFVHYLGGKGERTAMIVFFFSAFSCLSVLPMTIIQFQPMQFLQVVFLLLAGLCASAAQFSITAAYSCAPAREISVFDYSQVLFSAILGMIVLGEFPDYISVIGYVIIIGAAIAKYLLALREYQKNKKNGAGTR